MNRFASTRRGAIFFNGHVPGIIKALPHIGDWLDRIAVKIDAMNEAEGILSPHQPPDVLLTCQDRIRLAERLFEVSPYDEDLDSAPVDILANLMHWAHDNEVDFQALVNTAAIHFDAELDEGSEES